MFGRNCYAVFTVASLCFQLISGSYLDYPRIHFAGHFRADTDTRNNIACNYRLNFPVSDLLNADWGFNGTNEFQWFENVVTSVILQNGSESTTDAVVGKYITGNLERPFAKITDLDVDRQNKSTIYGMKFGLTWNASAPGEHMRFFGNWTRSVIAQNIWPRIKCYSENNTGPENELYQDSFPLGASGTTTIDNIDWNSDLGDSVALNQLRDASEAAGGKLQVRVTMFFYTRNRPSYIAYNATLGYVVGTIGVPSDDDTLNVPGQRIMNPTANVPIDVNETFVKGDLCYNLSTATLKKPYGPWMGKTPFKINSNMLHVDLSNSLPTNLHNGLLNIGNIQLGIYLDKGKCVQLIGTSYIPYLTEHWLEQTSGIYSINLNDGEVKLLKHSKLVIVQVVNGTGGSTDICGGEIFFSLPESHKVEILNEESQYFIRPSGYYVDRLSDGDVATQTFYVTNFGDPAADVDVKIKGSSTDVLPQDGVRPDSYMSSTNSTGYASFNFSIYESIPYPRNYSQSICKNDSDTTLPIDGQVYDFVYAVCPTDDECGDFDNAYAPSFLAFSLMNYSRPYTWVDHVQPILAQYAQVAPIMGKIMNLGSYHDVTVLRNKELLNLSLTRDFYDPAYMPVSRDLSPERKEMILSWLFEEDPPRYDVNNDEAEQEPVIQCNPPAIKSILPPENCEYNPLRCERVLDFDVHPMYEEKFFGEISNFSNEFVQSIIDEAAILLDRPLLGLSLRDNKTCNVTSLKRQLQSAISLEFATLPPYLTALYSIIDGCNREIYDIILSVVRQEMLHMTQAANTLIALGETPIIDSPEFVHSYPTQLPGGVLPGLIVTLEKLSLKHVHDVFMAIEVPENGELYTIGAFYDEISACIRSLEEENIFDPSSVSMQVQWPWEHSVHLGNVIIVNDTNSSLKGIELIVSQGEGSNQGDPFDIYNESLAHFYKFEEISCQNQLVRQGDGKYAFNGPEIPFNSDGVWNMRVNPSASCIDRNSNCYIEARAFHGAFRKLLKSLQTTFSGSPEEINKSVAIMESLHVHAKKTMWTKFKPNSADPTTCGPVWDYDWPE